MSHQLPPLPKKICIGGLSSDNDEVFGHTDAAMRAYAELAIASVKREPLNPTLIIDMFEDEFSLQDLDVADNEIIAFVRAIEQAHGITATTASKGDGDD